MEPGKYVLNGQIVRLWQVRGAYVLEGLLQGGTIACELDTVGAKVTYRLGTRTYTHTLTPYSEGSP